MTARRRSARTRCRRCTRSCPGSTGSAPTRTRRRRTTCSSSPTARSAERVGAVAIRHAELFAALPRVIIDHHASNDATRATPTGSTRAPPRPARWSPCSPSGSGSRSTSGDGALADALMAGVVMDTATFAHPNATPADARGLRRAGRGRRTALGHLAPPLPDQARHPAPAVRPRAGAAGDVAGPAASSGPRCVLGDLEATGAIPAHSEGIIDLLAQSETAEVAMLLKEQDDGTTRLSVRTKPGGVDATVLTGRSVAGARARRRGHVPAAAGRGGRRPRPRGGRAPRRRGAAVSPRDRSGGLDGVLIVAKPSGPTSHDVVGLVRRLSSTRRVGHGGTLDPFAAGVLPVFLGRATRLVEYHLGGVEALPRDDLLRRDRPRRTTSTATGRRSRVRP